MQWVLKIIIIFSISIFSFSQDFRRSIFVSGNEGYKTYRIPAIIGLPDGGLLAFCEGRVYGGSDFGDIDIVMKHSKDKGNTWSKLFTVVNNDSLQAGNPAPVVDLKDPNYPNGRIFLFYNTGNNSEREIRKGNGLREVWYITSTDGGITWSKAINITLQVHRPFQPKINPLYIFKEDWRSYANTPGHAIQILEGNYKGRIFVPANHSAGDPLPDFEDYQAHGFFTDDHGRTFHLSESISLPGSNESTAAGLSGDYLMMNSRNQKGDIKSRIVSISNTGGEHWDSVYFDQNLPDPVCEGSLINIGKKKGKIMLAFCNAADQVNRDNLTLRISFNEGKSWVKNILIDHDNSQKDNAAYSDIIRLNKKTIGVLYEKDNYTSIEFRKVKWR
ncbi:MAG: sialidase family protein [Saprospiraceae bacterium]